MPNMPPDFEEEEQQRYTLEDFKDMQEIGKQIISLYHDFSIKKGRDVPFAVFVGGIDYMIKSHKERVKAILTPHTTRIHELSKSFIKMEAEANELGIKIEEPYANNIDQLSKISPILKP